MTEFSGEVCVRCGEQIVEGDVQYRPGGTVKALNADGTEQPGNPLNVGMVTLCSKCAKDVDGSS